MHKLKSTYSQHDLELLRMIASAAGLLLHASNKRNAAIELASACLLYTSDAADE